jgi:hypothetical protein
VVQACSPAQTGQGPTHLLHPGHGAPQQRLDHVEDACLEHGVGELPGLLRGGAPGEALSEDLGEVVRQGAHSPGAEPRFVGLIPEELDRQSTVQALLRVVRFFSAKDLVEVVLGRCPRLPPARSGMIS